MEERIEILHLLADETRLRLLTSLLEGSATVSELTERLDLPQPRISTHLTLLRSAGLVAAETVGRQRVYYVDAERVGAVLEALEQLVGPAPEESREPLGGARSASAQAGREVRRNSPIRQARSCYDHLAGVAGVQLFDELLRRGWIVELQGEKPHYTLTKTGEHALGRLGVDLAAGRKTRRQFAYGCLDWTERRTHLGGAVGAILLDALERDGVVERGKQHRVVALTSSVVDWLDRAAE